MAVRERMEIFPTIKVNVAEEDETSVCFSDEVASNDYQIVSMQDVPTKTFGIKTTLTLLCVNDRNNYTIFVNQVSMNNLIEAYGNNDEKFKGKKVKLVLEKDAKYKKSMIVVKAG